MPPALQPATGDRRARSQAARLSQVQVTRGGAGVLSVLRQDRPEELARLVFERLRDALRAALDAATPPGNLRDLARRMREAVVEAKVSVQETRAAVTRAEGELVVERQRLADAERRGRLAAEIQDAETVAVAQRFAAKHRERVGVLERKLVDMQAQLGRAERDRPLTEAERSAERAWRELQRAGGSRPETDLQGDLLQSDLDRTAREAAADRQLRELK